MVLFVASFCISCLASVDQINRKPRLIGNLSKEPDDVNPSVNASTDKAPAPKTMQFGAYLACLLQKCWNPTLRMAPSGYPNGIS